jgi:hypothetical protein
MKKAEIKIKKTDFFDMIMDYSPILINKKQPFIDEYI